jgi:hypothetical protein
MQFLEGSTQVPRLPKITASQVEQFLAGGLGARGIPFIVTDAMDDWPCMRWTWESLKGELGDVVVETNGVTGPYTRMRGRFGDYLDYMRDPRDAATHIPPGFRYLDPESDEEAASSDSYPIGLQYLNAMNLDPVRRFTDAFPQPYFLDGRNLLDRLPDDVERLLFDKHTWVFIGPAGSLSKLHNDHDHVHTYIAQVFGKKHFILYSPAEASLLGKTDRHGITLTDCTVDPLDPDLERFPRFHEAHPWEGTIERGDLLFLPGSWLHWALGIEAGITVSRDCVDHLNFGAWFRSMAVDRLPKLMRRIVDHDAIIDGTAPPPLWAERLRRNRNALAALDDEFFDEES